MTLDLRACLEAKSDEGLLTKEKAERAADRFEQLQAQFASALEAGNKLEAEQADAFRRQQWTRLNELVRQNEVISRLDRNPDVAEQRVARSLFDFTTSGQISEQSVFRNYTAVRQTALSMISKAIERFEPRAAGLLDPENTTAGETKMRAIVRELFSEDSKDAEAKEMAQGISEGLEFLRQEFNRNGGNIDKREDFGMPQLHDTNRVAQVSKDEWIRTISPLLDRDKMIDFDTGERMSESQIDELLRESYDNITTSGLTEFDPTQGIAGGGKLTTRRQHMRFLQFRSADDWFEYQRQFGPNGGNIVTTLTGHIDKMSADIAQMRVLGPNPRNTLQAFSRTVRQRSGKRLDNLLENNLREVNGEANQPETPAGAGQTIAGAGIAARNFLTSSLLGQAFFSALVDVPFSAMAASQAGLRPSRVARRHARFMADRKDSQKHLNRLQLVNESQIEKGMAASRVSGEVLGTRGVAGLSRRAADVVMRASFLQPWTDMARGAFGEEFLATLTENAGRSLDELDPILRRTLERNGIDESKWESIRKAPRFDMDGKGTDIIRPLEVLESDREASFALQRMIASETEFAVPTGLSTVRAEMRRGTPPGTLAGEFLRSASLFKNFIGTVTALQFGRFAQIEGGLNKARYGTLLALTTGGMGLVAENFAALADGKEPPSIDPTTAEGRTNLFQGMWRAGSFGVLSDLVFTDFDRFGTSLGENLMGPVVSELLGPGINLTAGNLRTLLTEEGALREPLRSTDAGRDLVEFVQGMTPGQNLWWTNLAVQRLFFDNAQKLADPEAARSFRRIRQNAEEQGTDFFEGAAPGETLGLGQ